MTNPVSRFFMCERTARGNYLEGGCLRRDRAERKEAMAVIYSQAETLESER